ncbi:hypothetical protein WDW89_19955 [Deltaproteobacteria bacterium TL4]
MIGHKPFSDKRFFKQVFYTILTRNWTESKRNFKADAAGTTEERLRNKEQSVPKLELGNEEKLKVECRSSEASAPESLCPLIYGALASLKRHPTGATLIDTGWIYGALASLKRHPTGATLIDTGWIYGALASLKRHPTGATLIDTWRIYGALASLERHPTYAYHLFLKSHLDKLIENLFDFCRGDNTFQ